MYLRGESAQAIVRAAKLREVADLTFHPTLSQYTETEPTSSAPILVAPATGMPIA